jgi:hypothetical protein
MTQQWQGWRWGQRCGLTLTLAMAGILGAGSLPNRAAPLASQPAMLATAAVLPGELGDRLLRRISTTHQVPVRELRIVAAEPQNWSDSCLGLGGPAEICAAVITPGWEVTVASNLYTWVYRTNGDGTALRQASPEAPPGAAPPLPPLQAVADLKAHIARTDGVAARDLTVVDVAERLWDGCYGLPAPAGEVCPQVLVPGLQVVVQSRDRVWVYHTDQQGSVFHLNPEASQVSGATLAPRLLPTDAVPTLANPLPETVLSVIIQNPTTGQDYQVSLYSDRSLAGYDRSAENPDTDWAAVDLGSISYRDWFDLRDHLATTPLAAYDRLAYVTDPDPRAITYTLVLGNGVAAVQYDSAVVDQLPPNLQALISQWEPLWRDR